MELQPTSPGAKVDVITGAIDAALAANEQAHLPPSTVLEREVHDQIFAGVECGDLTAAEATERYQHWRTMYGAGKAAVAASQTQGVPKQQHNDNKRRMRRC